MERKPHSTGSIVGAVMLLIVVLLALYVGGYFALSTQGPSDASSTRRNYSYDWLARGFHPLAYIEGAVTGKLIVLIGPDWYYTSHGEAVRHPLVGQRKPVPLSDNLQSEICDLKSAKEVRTC